MTPKTKPDELNLVQKVAAIIAETDAFAKTNTNDGLRFKFIGINEVLLDIRPKFAKYQVLLFPTDIDVEKIEFHDRGSGKFSTHVFLKVIWELTDGGEKRVIATLGEALDTSDKASNKAQTAAQKQAIFKLLNIAAEADNDQNHYEHRYEAPAPVDPELARLKIEAREIVGKLSEQNLCDTEAVVKTMVDDEAIPAAWIDITAMKTVADYTTFIEAAVTYVRIEVAE